MPYSAHRPGRFGSDGRIEFDVPVQETEELYLDDLRRSRGDGADADGPEDPFPATEELLGGRFDDAIAMNAPAAVAPASEASETPESDASESDAFPGADDLDTEDASQSQPSGLRAGSPTAPLSRDQETSPAQDDPTRGVLGPPHLLFRGQDADRSEAEQPAGEAASIPTGRAARARRSRPRGSMSRRLAVLGGAEGSVLDHVPTETPRFVQMFFVLAGTALVSAISMYFALTTGVRILAWVAVPLALVWALIIFNLDRFLTSTMRSTRNVWRLVGLAIPRVIMAAIIGIVVAEPLVLQIFSNDIAREVNATNITQAQSDQDAVASGPEKLALDEASARVAALESQAATGIVAGAETTTATVASAQQTVDELTGKLAAQQLVIDQARAIYQCELTGEGAGEVAGCSGVAGDGASSGAAEDQLAAAQASYDDLATQLRTAEADLAAAQASSTAETSASQAQNKQQAQDELPAAREQYETALAAYNARASEIAGGNAGAVGLLSQIGALERLAQQEPVLGWAHWLIAALFFMIELLPVLVKVLTSYGDPSLYEKADALRRQVALDRVTARSWRERAEVAQGAEA